VSEKRALPEQPSLRYLKLEAKQRRAAGEFATLHDAQLALAREHGQPSWTALSEAVTAAAAAGSGRPALAHLAWIAARFGGAGEPGWAAPGEAELREHFAAEYLTRTPPGRLIAAITQVGADLHADLVVVGATRFSVYARLGGRLVTAATVPRPPYRLASIRQHPLGERISDPRTTAPPATAPARSRPWPPAPSPDSVSRASRSPGRAPASSRGRPRPAGPALSAPNRCTLSAAVSVACTFGVARLAIAVYRGSILRTGPRVPLRELLAR
jgi:hypothetical protein